MHNSPTQNRAIISSLTKKNNRCEKCTM